MKLKLTKITRFDKDKDGKTLITRDNRPYVRLIIGAEGYEKTLSGFDDARTKDWQIGSEVEVEVEQKGEYLNFRLPKKEDANAKHFEEIKSTLTTVKMLLNELVIEKRKNDKPKIAGTEIDYPTEEINSADIPF